MRLPRFRVLGAGCWVLGAALAAQPPSRANQTPYRANQTPYHAAQTPYHVADGWGKLPEGLKWGLTAGMAIDAQDRVYAFTRAEPPLIVLDGRDGKVLR